MAGRYQGLVLPKDGLESVAVTDDLLIVQPALAKGQRGAQAAAAVAAEQAAGSTTATGHSSGPLGDVPLEGVGTGGPDGAPTGTGAPATSGPPAKPRFFGTKDLTPERYGTDFKKIADEILVHLSTSSDIHLVVRVEIEATSHQGFDESKIRTVSENASTLKFDQSDFEES